LSATPATLLPVMTLEAMRDYNARIAYNRELGIEIAGLHGTGVELLLPWQDCFGGSHHKGHMHGGVIAALIDAACGLSMVVFTGRGAPTIDLRTDFLRGVGATDLRARGQLVRLGRTVANIDAIVHDAAGRHVASGRAVFSLGHQDPPAAP
jgi:uncharacterized protein (TIGR00369 family)